MRRSSRRKIHGGGWCSLAHVQCWSSSHNQLMRHPGKTLKNQAQKSCTIIAPFFNVRLIYSVSENVGKSSTTQRLSTIFFHVHFGMYWVYHGYSLNMFETSRENILGPRSLGYIYINILYIGYITYIYIMYNRLYKHIYIYKYYVS